MGAIVQTVAANVLDAVLATSTFTASTAPIKCRLMTANGSATAAGTELATAGGYTSGTGAPTVTFAAATGTPSTASSDVAVTVTNMPASTIVGVELWDSEGTPARKLWGALTASKTLLAGDTLTIGIGSLQAILN